MTSSARAGQRFEYDVCLSFAKENRPYVREVASELTKAGVRVFFDEYAVVELWGKDLYSHLAKIYKSSAKFCIMFISAQYAKRLWTNHERTNAQARAFRENREYILPARFDDTEIPGLPETVGYVDLRTHSASELAKLTIRKLGPRQTENYFPPEPDRYWKELGARSKKDRAVATARAAHFFSSLQKMTKAERRLVLAIFMTGCPAELPDNMHISLDLLRRETKISIPKIKEMLGRLGSIGFSALLRDSDPGEHLGSDGPLVVLEWHSNSTDDEIGGNSTLEATTAVKCAAAGFCFEHATEALSRLDFGNLSTSTAREDCFD